MKSIYFKATNYEWFIRNAHGCKRGMRNGAHLCFMKNTIKIEKKGVNNINLGSFEKQFEEVKIYMLKALDKLTYSKIYNHESTQLKLLYFMLEYATSTEELMRVVDSGLELIIRNKKSEIC